MEYGIFFKRPKTKKRGFNLPDDYINIEVHTWSEKNESSENPEEILLKINRYWNKSEKLFTLQAKGTIYHLGRKISECDTEYNRFKGNAGVKIDEIINDVTGDITYIRKSKEDYMDVYLENPLYMCEKDEIDKTASEQEWSYVFIFDEVNKNFTYRKIDE
jgi:hypothetical protein